MRRRLAYQCGALSVVPRLARLTFLHPGCDAFDLKFSPKLRMCPCSPRQRRISYACPAGTKSDPWVWLLPMTRYKSHQSCSPEVLAIKIQCRATWNTYEMTGSQWRRGDTTGLLIAKRRWSEYVMRGPVWIAVRMCRRPGGSESRWREWKEVGCFVLRQSYRCRLFIIAIESAFTGRLVHFQQCPIRKSPTSVRILKPEKWVWFRGTGTWTQRSKVPIWTSRQFACKWASVWFMSSWRKTDYPAEPTGRWKERW